MTLRELTDVTELDDLVAGPLPVLIGFVAQRCGPCLQQRPIWDEIGRTHAAELAVVMVDVDHLPELRDRYAVHGLPTTVLVVDGEVRDSQSGVRTTRMLLELLGLPAA